MRLGIWAHATHQVNLVCKDWIPHGGILPVLDTLHRVALVLPAGLHQAVHAHGGRPRYVDEEQAMRVGRLAVFGGRRKISFRHHARARALPQHLWDMVNVPQGRVEDEEQQDRAQDDRRHDPHLQIFWRHGVIA